MKLISTTFATMEKLHLFSVNHFGIIAESHQIKMQIFTHLPQQVADPLNVPQSLPLWARTQEKFFTGYFYCQRSEREKEKRGCT